MGWEHGHKSSIRCCCWGKSVGQTIKASQLGVGWKSLPYSSSSSSPGDPLTAPASRMSRLAFINKINWRQNDAAANALTPPTRRRWESFLLPRCMLELFVIHWLRFTHIYSLLSLSHSLSPSRFCLSQLVQLLFISIFLVTFLWLLGRATSCLLPATPPHPHPPSFYSCFACCFLWLLP